MKLSNNDAGVDATELDCTHPKVEFLVHLGKALHACGISSFRLEQTLLLIAQRLDVPLQPFAVPTGLFLAVGELDRQILLLLRVEPASINLERIALLDTVAEDVLSGRFTPGEGTRRVQAIQTAGSRYGPWLTTICYCWFSAAVAVLFEGGWRELLAASTIGLCTGLLAATMAPLVAGLAHLLIGPISGYLVIASGLIVLMPGLSLTTGISELANGHLSSGTARLAGAGVVFMALTFGTAVGKALASLLPGVTFVGAPEALPGWAEAPATLVCALCLAVLFQARPMDTGWITVSAVTAILGSHLGTTLLGSQLGGFVAAFTLGVAGNTFGRVLGRSSLIFLIPGITMLVPGSVGYKSLSALLEHDVVSGVNTAFTMSLIAISLLAGLLLSNLVVSPRTA
jgi:uncharacterized membrane protein YjjP (DUF1212 family)